jgi:hypothetical protein
MVVVIIRSVVTPSFFFEYEIKTSKLIIMWKADAPEYMQVPSGHIINHKHLLQTLLYNRITVISGDRRMHR